ncbi:MAG: hypothetical protein ACRC28_17275 [Clostridium sp.]|uniref:hypothetical protein n=1 Tax=Clostridium sp. TaxID=1506 RepID=UPI003F2C7A45
MSTTLSLDRNYLDDEPNFNESNPKKKKTLLKVIVSLIIVIIIFVVGFTCYYLYFNNKDLSSINSNINTYNTLVSTVNENSNPTESDYSSYSTKFSNLSNTFKSYENSIFLNSESKTLTTNYANLTSYLAYNEDLLSKYLTYTSEVENLSSPNLDQLQGLINKFNGLLSSNDFTQMKNMYNNDPFVKQNISKTSSPTVFEDMVNKTVSKLSNTSKYEVFANNIANFFGLGDIFKNSMQIKN